MRIISKQSKVQTSVFRPHFHFKRFSTRQTLIGQCCYGGLILALSVGFSLLLEFHHTLFGVGFRFVDCCLIVVTMPLLGLPVALMVGFSAPLVHVACDADHAPIEVLQQMLMNVITVLIVYFGYFMWKNRLFNRTKSGELAQKYRWFKRIEPIWLFALFFIIYVIQLFSFFAMIALLTFNPAFKAGKIEATYGTGTNALYRQWSAWLLVAGFFSLKYLITLGVFYYITPRLSSMISR